MATELYIGQGKKGPCTFDGATIKGAMERLRRLKFDLYRDDDFYDCLFSLIAISDSLQRAVLSRSFLCYVIAWERYEISELDDEEFFKRELEL